MKKSLRLYLAALVFLLHPELAHSKNDEQGRVIMQGAIIEPACDIEISNKEQAVIIGDVPLSKLISDKQSGSYPFSIKLVKCSTERKETLSRKKFMVVFDGDSDGELFNIDGNASGVGLRISDQKGQTASPGVPLTSIYIDSDNMQLNYFVQIISNNGPLSIGIYFTSIRFTLSYF